LQGFLLFIGKTQTWKNLRIIARFGLMFMVWKQSMKLNRSDYQPFIDLMQTGKNPLLGASLGRFFTLIIQSSSAVAIVVTAWQVLA